MKNYIIFATALAAITQQISSSDQRSTTNKVDNYIYVKENSLQAKLSHERFPSQEMIDSMRKAEQGLITDKLTKGDFKPSKTVVPKVRSMQRGDMFRLAAAQAADEAKLHFNQKKENLVPTVTPQVPNTRPKSNDNYHRKILEMRREYGF